MILSLRDLEKFFRGRREQILPLLALLFFSGAIAVVIGGGETSPSTSSTSQVPSSLEDIDAYIEGKARLLEVRGQDSPAVTSYSVVSFKGFLTAASAEELLSQAGLKALTVHFRIPVEGRDREKADVTEGLAATLQAPLGEEVIRLRAEVKDLRDLIPTVDDPSFADVYKEDAAAKEAAIVALESDPRVIFALTLERATYRQLLELAGAEVVRLIDVPEDPKLDVRDAGFQGILPS